SRESPAQGVVGAGCFAASALGRSNRLNRPRRNPGVNALTGLMDTLGSLIGPSTPNRAAKTPPPFSGLKRRPISGIRPGSVLKKYAGTIVPVSADGRMPRPIRPLVVSPRDEFSATALVR